MDYFKFQAQKHLPKWNKRRLTQDQQRLLETSFNFNTKLEPDRKFQLAQELGLPPRQVAIWYQNKRARWKNQSLEMDYKALQLRLENALGDNKRLEKEVHRLKQELDKAHKMLLSSSNTAYSSFSSLSASCDEDGSSSFLDNSKSCLEKEFYACLTGGEDQL
ncbi:hypothetical protein L1049_010487 [Liquidambar formosana]|uniref:Homeobox-leucine zipper protein n=1 Tax=Liquidambar formosana TaxID=63359 RepID=A0AAP0R4X5_LIQFO